MNNKHNNPPTLCRTYDDVLAVLGGVTRVAEMTSRSKAAVSNWRRKRGKFVPEVYFIMVKALKARNAVAPRALWGFEGENLPAELAEYDAS